MEPGLFGRAVMFPDDNFGNFNECREFVATGCGPFTETDVVINAGFGEGWTPDWFNPGNDQRGGLAMVQATVLHEVGHTLGLHHIFQLPGTNANSFSVMNYANDDAARWVTRIDSKTVRTEYPSRSGSLLDVAIYPLVYGNDKYAQEYATLSKSSVAPGESFTADRWTLQNVGNQAASQRRRHLLRVAEEQRAAVPAARGRRPRQRRPSARSPSTARGPTPYPSPSPPVRPPASTTSERSSP